MILNDDFGYSSALLESSRTWDDEALGKFLQDPKSMVQGIRTRTGLRRDDGVLNNFAYLAGVSADGTAN